MEDLRDRVGALRFFLGRETLRADFFTLARRTRLFFAAAFFAFFAFFFAFFLAAMRVSLPPVSLLEYRGESLKGKLSRKLS